MSDKDSRLVYSTATGRVRAQPAPPGARKGDGIVRIRRETSGRKGKGVTTISGVPLADAGLEDLARKLKQKCATGGSVKDGVIEIQGDHREAIKAQLTALGFVTKFAGG